MLTFRRAASIALVGSSTSLVGYSFLKLATLGCDSNHLVNRHSTLRPFLQNHLPPVEYSHAHTRVSAAIACNKPREVLELLEQHPETIDQTYLCGGMGGDSYETILDKAFWEGSFDVAQVLIENGVKVDDGLMYDPLFTAAKYGHSGLMKAIAKQKPSAVSAVDDEGNTALFYAIPTKKPSTGYSDFAYFLKSMEFLPAMKSLIDLGVDPAHRNHEGKTVYDELEDKGLKVIASTLRAYETLSGSKIKLRNRIS